MDVNEIRDPTRDEIEDAWRILVKSAAVIAETTNALARAQKLESDLEAARAELADTNAALKRQAALNVQLMAEARAAKGGR